MSQRIEIEGTLHEDGSLVLDQRVDLPAGRVRVLAQPVIDPSQTEVWRVLDRIWDGQRLRGHVTRTRDDIDREFEQARQADETRTQELEQIHQQARQARQQANLRASASRPG
jgi:hypothetical protein